MPKLKLKTRVCPGCGKTETGPSRNLVSQYCSRECWKSSSSCGRPRAGKTIDCSYCSKPFYTRESNAKRGAKYCSQECSIKDKARTPYACELCGELYLKKNAEQRFCSHSCSKKGELNPNWNDKDTIVDCEGYIQIKTDTGYIREHKLIAEKVIGRTLISNEVVHHVNENKQDNTKSNLVICSRSYHMWLHRKMQRTGVNFRQDEP